MLDGRAEVVAYTRDSSKFFLRVRVPEKAGYKSRRIDGVETLDAAVDAALDTYVQLGSADRGLRLLLIKSLKDCSHKRLPFNPFV